MTSHQRHIGQMIKTIREFRGLTQAQLAKSIGTQHPYISDLENGKQNPTIDLLMKVGTALNCYVDINFTPIK